MFGKQVSAAPAARAKSPQFSPETAAKIAAKALRSCMIDVNTRRPRCASAPHLLQ